MSATAIKRLNKELRQLNESPSELFTIGLVNEDDLFTWCGIIFGPSDTIYEGGMFRFEMKFPSKFPIEPPSFRFLNSVFHPNVYSDGRVCISILNKGEDQFGYEATDERWTPVRSIESILISICSIIADPNIDSPANVDSSVLYRDNREEFNRLAIKCVKDSQI